MNGKTKQCFTKHGHDIYLLQQVALFSGNSMGSKFAFKGKGHSSNVRLSMQIVIVAMDKNQSINLHHGIGNIGISALFSLSAVSVSASKKSCQSCSIQ